MMVGVELLVNRIKVFMNKMYLRFISKQKFLNEKNKQSLFKIMGLLMSGI